jgi:hypothetical protein
MVTFRYPRRLVFQMRDAARPESFNGWYCERCCWSIRLTDIDRAPRVNELFHEHDCDTFALAHWTPPPDEGCSPDR